MVKEVTHAFAKLLDSRTFKDAAVLVELLRFLFEESIVKERNNLTAYVIATEGLNQPASFDAQKNPLVRVQAARLRKLLDAYYLDEGVADPWRINMPKGGYHLRVFKSGTHLDNTAHRRTTGRDLAPRIAVLPFDNLSGDDSNRYICDGITQEIIHIMATSREIQLLASGTTFHYRVGQEQFSKVAQELGVDYLLHGSIRMDAQEIRVTTFLYDAHTEQHVWTEQYQHKLSPQSIFEIQESIASMIAHHVTTPYGAIHRHMRTKSIDDFAAYAAILRYYQYQEDLSPETHKIAVDAIERTIMDHPEYAEAWGCIAGLYAAEHMFGFNVRKLDRPPLERALEAARKSLQLLPDSIIGLYGLANSYYYLGDREAFRVAAQRAIELAPNRPEVLGGLSLQICYDGQWTRGLAMLDKARELNPLHPGWYWFPYAIHHYKNDDYEQALSYAQRINMPGFFWDHTFLAMILGQLGRINEAKTHLEKALTLNPALATTAYDTYMVIMQNPELVKKCLAGLEKAGLPTQKIPS